MVSHTRGDSLGQGLILLIPVFPFLPFLEWGFNATYIHNGLLPAALRGPTSGVRLRACKGTFGSRRFVT
jgi:hypothetical protein